jgi:peptide/nickel transport system substrate-binding protein
MGKLRLRKLSRLFFHLFLAVAFLAVCADDVQSASSSIDTSGTLYRDSINIAITQQANTYDLHKTGLNAPKMIFNGTVFEKLVTLNSKGQSTPELAERFEISPNCKEITFYLRKGVKFHDGSEMTAKAVVQSLNRWIGSYSPPANLAKDARFVEVDDYIVKINLPAPAASFVDLLAGSGNPAVITSEAAVYDEDANGFWKNYIGTGPYKFVEWAQDQYIKLEKFDDYSPYGDSNNPVDGWAVYKTPKTKTLYYHYVPDAATRVAGLETGQYDAIFALEEDHYAYVESKPDLVINNQLTGVQTIVFNKRQGPVTDPYLRQAINAAVNCEDLMRAGNGDRFVLDSSYMEENQYWYSTAGSEYYNQHDIARAKELLAKSNYNGEVIRISVITDRIAAVLQQELKEIGVESEILLFDSSAWSQNNADPAKWDIYITSWISHPIPPLKPFLNAGTGGWSNDEKLQRYLNDFFAAVTPEAAKAIWDEAQLYCWEWYMPIISLGHRINSYAWTDKLENVVTHEGIYFWNATIKK